jgi:anaerobic selenocysteine-containing dehydrogenase
MMPMGAHSDERNPKTWRTMATDYPAIMGVFPPNVLPEEIDNDRLDRVRAVIVSDSNPLRSYADTTAYEAAFSELDLLVTLEISMSETAALSDYVLPARSPYEAWDGTFFSLTYPGIFFQMRHPVLPPSGEALETSEIFVRLADRLGLIPEIPQELVEAARGDRMAFGATLMGYFGQHPEAAAMAPFVLAKTLGVALGSSALSALWGLLMTAPEESRKNAARAGFEPGPAMGEEIFQAILEHPEGIWVGRTDDDQFGRLKTDDGRVNILIEELAESVTRLDAVSEAAALAPDPEFPLVLGAGFRTDNQANTLMRNPVWIKGRRACTARIHPSTAGEHGISDGDTVRVATEAGEVQLEAEVTETVRPGQVAIPHGFGLDYEGGAYGINVNRLTPAANRDPIAGTPYHRYIPCRVTKG